MSDRREANEAFDQLDAELTALDDALAVLIRRIRTVERNMALRPAFLAELRQIVGRPYLGEELTVLLP